MSAYKTERVEAAKMLKGPEGEYKGDKKAFIDAIHSALYASKICSYAQGFALIKAAAKEYNWNINFGDMALLWRGGCIIRAVFLEDIKKRSNAIRNLPTCFSIRSSLKPSNSIRLNGVKRLSKPNVSAFRLRRSPHPLITTTAIVVPICPLT